MLNKKQILVLIILSIFTIGMIMGTATAAHKFKCGKYKGKLTNKQYKALKKAKEKGLNKFYIVKTGKYIKFKENGKIKKDEVFMTIGVSNAESQIGKQDYLVVWTSDGPLDGKNINIK